MPDHAVQQLLTLVFKPLFARPSNWNSNGQQQAAANEIKDELSKRSGRS
jgi:hypothetical protein